MPNGFVESTVKGVQPHSSARMLSNAKLITGGHSGPARQLYLHRDGELVYSRRGQDLKTPGLEATEGRLTALLHARGSVPVCLCTNSGRESAQLSTKAWAMTFLKDYRFIAFKYNWRPLLSGAEQSHVA